MESDNELKGVTQKKEEEPQKQGEKEDNINNRILQRIDILKEKDKYDLIQKKNDDYKISTRNNINNSDNINRNRLKKGINYKRVDLTILVRSRYILKEIFSFLDERKKLIIIKYNKIYNKLFGITIEQYKKSSGKIKIDGINEYGKE